MHASGVVGDRHLGPVDGERGKRHLVRRPLVRLLARAHGEGPRRDRRHGGYDARRGRRLSRQRPSAQHDRDATRDGSADQEPRPTPARRGEHARQLRLTRLHRLESARLVATHAAREPGVEPGRKPAFLAVVLGAGARRLQRPAQSRRGMRSATPSRRWPTASSTFRSARGRRAGRGPDVGGRADGLARWSTAREPSREASRFPLGRRHAGVGDHARDPEVQISR